MPLRPLGPRVRGEIGVPPRLCDSHALVLPGSVASSFCSDASTAFCFWLLCLGCTRALVSPLCTPSRQGLREGGSGVLALHEGKG